MIVSIRSKERLQLKDIPGNFEHLRSRNQLLAVPQSRASRRCCIRIARSQGRGKVGVEWRVEEQ